MCRTPFIVISQKLLKRQISENVGRVPQSSQTHKWVQVCLFQSSATRIHFSLIKTPFNLASFILSLFFFLPACLPLIIRLFPKASERTRFEISAQRHGNHLVENQVSFVVWLYE